MTPSSTSQRINYVSPCFEITVSAYVIEPRSLQISVTITISYFGIPPCRWMFGFFRSGYKRPLVQEDLYEVLQEDSAAAVVEKLER